MKSLKNFYEGGYAKYILPGVLLQSVLIGGGYATGREIYSYGAKFGAMGWISGLTIGIGFALFAFLTFEICRIYKVYDYKNYIRQVIGPLWPVMDILTVLIAIVLIAVMAAATGSIFEQVGLPNILGSDQTDKTEGNAGFRNYRRASDGNSLVPFLFCNDVLLRRHLDCRRGRGYSLDGND